MCVIDVIKVGVRKRAVTNLTMTDDSQKPLIVQRETVIRTAYRQYREANGGYHGLTIEEGEELVELCYTNNGKYSDDTIRADEIATVDFQKDANNAIAAVLSFEEGQDTVEVAGTEYSLEFIDC